MRVFCENARTQLAALSACLARDATSLEGWFCLHMPGLLANLEQPEALAREAAFARIERLTTGLEGSVFACPDGDVLVVHRTTSLEGKVRLATLLGEAGNGQGHFVSFDLFRDREAARLVMNDKLRNWPLTEAKPDMLPAGASLAAAEIRTMRRVLRNPKSTRRYRSPMQVLLVEDDDLTRRVAGNVLKHEHVLITAANAYEAVVNYLLHAPEIVFLDIDLPDQSGFGVLEQITACDPDAYVVMFSGNDSLDNIVNALTRGAQGFITKPFEKSRLRHYLASREVAQIRERGESILH